MQPGGGRCGRRALVMGLEVAGPVDDQLAAVACGLVWDFGFGMEALRCEASVIMNRELVTAVSQPGRGHRPGRRSAGGVWGGRFWARMSLGRNRLEGIPMAQIAAEMRISHAALCNRRKRAEKALTDAIRNGRLSDIASDATYDAVRERRRSGAT